MYLGKMSNDLKLVCVHGANSKRLVKIELERTQSFKPTCVALRIMINTCAI